MKVYYKFTLFSFYYTASLFIISKVVLIIKLNSNYLKRYVDEVEIMKDQNLFCIFFYNLNLF